MNLLFVFLDGVGLGSGDPHINPLAGAHMPALQELLGGERLLLAAAPLDSPRASLRALDTCLGIAGLPQSATGQAALLTGQNVPAALGYHYGPKPNPAVAAYIQNGNLFNHLHKAGRHAAFINAYPPGYFQGIQSGRRLYSAIPLAAVSAGLPLLTQDDLHAGRAISADFTAQGWRQHLNQPDTPVLSPFQAGERLAALAAQSDFTLFEYWLSDYAGHHQDMPAATSLLETFDQVLAGLLASWDDQAGLILITSDHGNLEDLGTRRHTANPVPALLIGAPHLRQRFVSNLHDLTGIAPAILAAFSES
ncbi:MAG: alkaline phosphatase family protein [Chloroflexota bacterium]